MTLNNELFEKCLLGDNGSIYKWNLEYDEMFKEIKDDEKKFIILDPEIIKTLEDNTSTRTRKNRLIISRLHLDKSNLSKIDIKNIIFKECNLKNVCFHDTFISECSFEDTNLDFADFKYASLRNVEFRFSKSSEIQNISFRWADLLKTNFKNIKFVPKSQDEKTISEKNQLGGDSQASRMIKDSNLPINGRFHAKKTNGNKDNEDNGDGDKYPFFSWSTINQVTFVNCRFTGVNFLSSKIRGVFFERDSDQKDSKDDTTTLSQVNFTGSEILPSNFINLQICQCHFDKCNLKSVDFKDSTISDSSFEDSNLGNSNFANAIISHTSFRRSILNYVNFKGSTFKKCCKFYRTNLYHANLSHVHPRLGKNFIMSTGQRYKESRVTSKFDITFLSFVMVVVGFLSVLMSSATKLTRFLCILLLSLFLVIMAAHYTYKKFRFPDLALYIWIIIIMVAIGWIIAICVINFNIYGGLFWEFDFKVPFFPEPTPLSSLNIDSVMNNTGI